MGTGPADLPAARDLVTAGAEVVTLEVRDRTSGRIWTQRLWPDHPIDMGTSAIHGVQGNPARRLVDVAGAVWLAPAMAAHWHWMGRSRWLT